MTNIGKYFMFIGRLFQDRERFSVYTRLILNECMDVGISSVFIVAVVSTFLGAVTCIQTAYNLISPLVPLYVISLIVRDSTILELAPTILSIVLSGKVGSSIAGQLGTMRITEQIDALEVMGINSASYLVLPKVIACVVMFPLLIIMGGFLSIYGGYVGGMVAGVVSSEDYILGLQTLFKPFSVPFAIIKAVVFAFLVATISAYRGFYTTGGALEVGKSSTIAVTNSCIAILIADLLLAKLLL